MATRGAEGPERCQNMRVRRPNGSEDEQRFVPALVLASIHDSANNRNFHGIIQVPLSRSKGMKFFFKVPYLFMK